MKYDYEQIKHIYEAFIEEHFDSINRLVTATYISTDYFLDEFEAVITAMEMLPVTDSDFNEWLICDDPHLAILLTHFKSTLGGINATFNQIQVEEVR
ncbi:hypothetical protein CF038_11270 [Klebsiella michiganensis]|uniref:hypothetical protein n=1 Tax=Klebsiella michiganensis TaxID=1134687 RepID=UPI001CA4DC09|nr:hypothetical protein [Klebsiella michiganensis]MBW5993233.1 hypothetical protein [Klebsiella michiganensis]